MNSQAEETHKNSVPEEVHPAGSASEEPCFEPVSNKSEANTSGPEINKDPEKITDPKDEIHALKEKISEWNDRYLRLYADFENYQKRIQKEKLEWMKYAGEDVIRHLLPIMDDFERAIRHNEKAEEIQGLKEGFVLIYQKLLQYLRQKGLEPMESIGNPFNADCMEAVTQVPATDPELKGKVVDEVEKGYKLHDKLIRRAKVVVGS